jgi:hypothetical protein
LRLVFAALSRQTTNVKDSSKIKLYPFAYSLQFVGGGTPSLFRIELGAAMSESRRIIIVHTRVGAGFFAGVVEALNLTCLQVGIGPFTNLNVTLVAGELTNTLNAIDLLGHCAGHRALAVVAVN